jgi:hypothetical protein
MGALCYRGGCVGLPRIAEGRALIGGGMALGVEGVKGGMGMRLEHVGWWVGR